MFGLFKNKKEEKLEEKPQKEVEKKKKEHPEFLVLVEKWENFLSKIDARFEESIRYAEEAVLDNLVESNFDLLPTTRAWSGIKSQLMELTDKIEGTFDTKVKPQMEEYKKEWKLIDEGQKGTVLAESIYHRIERHERLIEGKIAKTFYNHAIQFLNEDFNCTQCSAKLEVKKDIFRSHYVSCNYCNTVNTFTPNTKIAEIRGVIDNIARYNSIEEWDKYKKAEDDFHEIRCPSEDDDKTAYTNGFQKREETEQAYWEKFLKERNLLLPEYEEKFEHDLSVKMKYFYEERKRELGF